MSPETLILIDRARDAVEESRTLMQHRRSLLEQRRRLQHDHFAASMAFRATRATARQLLRDICRTSLKRPALLATHVVEIAGALELGTAPTSAPGAASPA